MLTARGAALLAGAGLLWFVGRLLGVDELYVAAIAAAALVVLAGVLVWLPGDRIAVRRLLGSGRLGFDAEAEIAVDVRNDGRLPSPALRITDAVPPALAEDAPQLVVESLPPRRTVTLRYRVRGAHRGRYPIGPVQLRLSDPFGLVRRTRRTRRVDEVVVYPRVEALPEVGAARLPQSRSDGDQHRVLELGDEFHTMREYVQGDDLRRVHWPSTARQQKLMVRQHELPWRAETTILLDTRAGAHTTAGPASTFETAVSAAASAGCHLGDRQHVLRLATDVDGASPRVVGRRALLDRLAVVAASEGGHLGGVGNRLRSGGRGLLLACVTPPPADEPVPTAADTRALLHAGRGFGSRAAIVVHTPRGADRAAELAALLRTAGWRSVTLPAGGSLAHAWPALARRAAATAASPPS